MSLPTNIVVATDFSESSEKAAQYALALAKASGAQVHLVHAWVMPVMVGDEAAFYTEAFVQRIGADAEQAMASLVARLAGESPALHSVVLSGDPRDVVPRVALEKRADLIVLGTHGRHGLRRVLLGSVAEAIARHAPCSVLIVR